MARGLCSGCEAESCFSCGATSESEQGMLVQETAAGDLLEPTAVLGQEDDETSVEEVVDTLTVSDFSLLASMNPEELNFAQRRILMGINNDQ